MALPRPLGLTLAGRAGNVSLDEDTGQYFPEHDTDFDPVSLVNRVGSRAAGWDVTRR